jgi:hypothetical protein
VDWGDGTNENFTSTGSTGNARSHLYSVSGVRTITIDRPDRVTHFDIRDVKTSQLLGPQVCKMFNLTNFRLLTATTQHLNWTVTPNTPMFPSLQYMQIELQAGLNWVVNGDFPPINDVLNLRNVTGITWAIGPANPIPVDVESLTIRECAGITYARTAPSLPAWRVNDLSIVRIECGWTTAMVDAFLLDLSDVFPFKAVAGGTIDLLGGTPANQAPSGSLPTACPPISGVQAKAELVSDTCGRSANHWASVTTA